MIMIHYERCLDAGLPKIDLRGEEGVSKNECVVGVSRHEYR